jgi:TonB family protein
LRIYIIRSPLAALSLVLLLMGVAVTIRAQQSSPQQPSVVQAVAPVYPPIAASAGASGKVVIEAQVDSRGIVTSVRTLEGLKLLGKAAEDSARRWVFAPTSEHASIRVVCLTFTFKLMPDDVAPDELLPIFMPPYHVEVRRTVPRVVDNPNIDPPINRQPPRPRKKRP